MVVQDRVWSEVLPILMANGRFTVSDLSIEEETSERIRDVCQEMEDCGYLEQCPDTNAGWRAGPRARRNLELTERAKLFADRDNEYWVTSVTDS